MRQTDYQTNASREDRWLSCQECHTWMMPLDRYEVEDGTWETPEASGCAPGGH